MSSLSDLLADSSLDANLTSEMNKLFGAKRRKGKRRMGSRKRKSKSRSKSRSQSLFKVLGSRRKSRLKRCFYFAVDAVDAVKAVVGPDQYFIAAKGQAGQIGPLMNRLPRSIEGEEGVIA